MPIATFPQKWDIQLIALLQEKIGQVARKKAAKVVVPVDKVRLVFIADKFLRLYRSNLRASSVFVNLNIPSVFYPGPIGGYRSYTEATNKPLFGAIGIPSSMHGAQYALTEKIQLGIYAQLQTKTGRGKSQVGVLTFNFREFSEDTLAKYHDGTNIVSWVRLVEYGFDVGGYAYVPKIGVGRSGYGVMRPSKRYDFKFAATHLFEDTFRLTKRMMTPEEQLLLITNFLE